MCRGARVVSSPRTLPSAVCRGPPRSAKELPLSPRTLVGTQATDWGLCNRVIFPALDLIRSHLILLLVGAHNSGRGAAIQPPIMINYDFQKFTKEIYTNLNGHSHKKLLTENSASFRAEGADLATLQSFAPQPGWLQGFLRHQRVLGGGQERAPLSDGTASL